MRYSRLFNSRHSWVASSQGTAGDMQQLPEQGDEKLVFLPTPRNAKHPVRSDYTQIQYQQLTSDFVKGKALQLTRYSTETLSLLITNTAWREKPLFAWFREGGWNQGLPPVLGFTVHSDLILSALSPLDSFIISPGDNQVQFMSCKKKKKA